MQWLEDVLVLLEERNLTRAAALRNITQPGAVNLMRTSIRLLTQPKSTRSIIDATQREQRLGSS